MGLPDGTKFYNQKMQFVGQMQDGWLVKHVIVSKHQMRRPPGWCIDQSHYEALVDNRCQGVRLIDDKGRVWRATLAVWKKKMIVFNKKGVYGDHGKQYMLCLGDWTIDMPGYIQEELPFC